MARGSGELSEPAQRSRRRRPRALAAAALVLAAGLAQAACASTDEAVAGPPGYVALSEFARPLGLRRLPRDGASSVVLQSHRGERMALIVGGRQAIVRGVPVGTTGTILEEVDEVWIDASDADRLRRAWATIHPTSGTVARAGRGRTTPLPSYRPSPTYRSTPTYSPAPVYRPSTPTAGGTNRTGAMRPLPPRPVIDVPGPVVRTPPPARPSPSAGGGSVSAAERAAWGVPLRRKWNYIVVHHSATESGNATTFDVAHRKKGWDGLGYDFVIGNGSGSGDGQVETGWRWTQQRDGAHAGNKVMNQQGIGICLVGDFTHHPPSAAQMRSLQRLCDFLAGHCDIPPGNLRMHRDVRDTACPGEHFPTSFRIGGGTTYAR